jgi:hypothetical protein
VILFGFAIILIGLTAWRLDVIRQRGVPPRVAALPAGAVT